jgi:hypothetical protein
VCRICSGMGQKCLQNASSKLMSLRMFAKMAFVSDREVPGLGSYTLPRAVNAIYTGDELCLSDMFWYGTKMS